MKKYTDEDLLKLLLRQIKIIDVDAEKSSTDKIVSATIIYKNGSETDCKLPRKLIDYLTDRVNDLFKKDMYTEEVNYSMKKYTDTELLETLLSMLHYSISTYIRADAVSVLDTVDFRILESSDYVSRSFIIALEDRISKLANEIPIKVEEDKEHKEE